MGGGGVKQTCLGFRHSHGAGAGAGAGPPLPLPLPTGYSSLLPGPPCSLAHPHPWPLPTGPPSFCSPPLSPPTLLLPPPSHPPPPRLPPSSLPPRFSLPSLPIPYSLSSLSSTNPPSHFPPPRYALPCPPAPSPLSRHPTLGPFVHHILVPFMTNRSPLLSARHFMLHTSEPAPASLMARAPMCSPAQACGRNGWRKGQGDEPPRGGKSGGDEGVSQGWEEGPCTLVDGWEPCALPGGGQPHLP